MASRVTTVSYVDHFSLRRQREQRQKSLAVRHLNDGSPLFRFHVMRNRGYMAHYLRHLGTYNRLGYGVGTLLTFAKEVVRLVYVQHTLRGFGDLVRGWSAARKIMREPWMSMNSRHGDSPRTRTYRTIWPRPFRNGRLDYKLTAARAKPKPSCFEHSCASRT